MGELYFSLQHAFSAKLVQTSNYSFNTLDETHCITFYYCDTVCPVECCIAAWLKLSLVEVELRNRMQHECSYTQVMS